MNGAERHLGGDAIRARWSTTSEPIHVVTRFRGAMRSHAGTHRTDCNPSTVRNLSWSIARIGMGCQGKIPRAVVTRQAIRAVTGRTPLRSRPSLWTVRRRPAPPLFTTPEARSLPLGGRPEEIRLEPSPPSRRPRVRRRAVHVGHHIDHGGAICGQRLPQGRSDLVGSLHADAETSDLLGEAGEIDRAEAE